MEEWNDGSPKAIRKKNDRVMDYNKLDVVS